VVIPAICPDRFSFLVNDLEYITTVVEAATVSPAVCEQLSVDSCARRFVISDPEIDPEYFPVVQQFLSGSPVVVSPSSRDSVLRLCQCLSNFELASCVFGRESEEVISLDGVLRATNSARSFDLHSLGELSLLAFDTIDAVLGSSFLRIESEDVLLTCILDLGPDYSSLLRHIHWGFLSLDGVFDIGNEPGLIAVTESMWGGVHPWMKVVIPRSIKLDSLIVPGLPSIFTELSAKTVSLLWRGSRDGFSAADFHSRCDGRPNTLTLILDRKGNIFGGFTPAAWESPRRRWIYKRDCSFRSFLFTLKNPHNLSPRRFRLKDEQRAIYCCGACGPVFGHGYDLFVADNCYTTAHSHSGFFGASYENDSGIPAEALFTDSHFFVVQEIEVFELSN
jgi:hypothetical protein